MTAVAMPFVWTAPDALDWAMLIGFALLQAAGQWTLAAALQRAEVAVLQPWQYVKLAWALGNRARFPVDVNRADKESLLRVPGFGTKAVAKILQVRRYRSLRLEDVGRLCQSLEKVRPFITAVDWSPGGLVDDTRLRDRLTPQPQQLSLF